MLEKYFKRLEWLGSLKRRSEPIDENLDLTEQILSDEPYNYQGIVKDSSKVVDSLESSSINEILKFREKYVTNRSNKV